MRAGVVDVMSDWCTKPLYLVCGQPVFRTVMCLLSRLQLKVCLVCLHVCVGCRGHALVLNNLNLIADLAIRDGAAVFGQGCVRQSL